MNTEITYVLDQFCRQYQLRERPAIGYGPDQQETICVSDAGRDFLTDRQLPAPDNARWYSFDDIELPLIFHDDAPELITRNNGKTRIHFDLFAEVFFWLSGWQECSAENLDHYGRFSWEKSLQHRWGITGKPVVNYYFDLLARMLEIPGTVRKPKNFRIALTHDIDRVTSGWQEDCWFCAKNGQMGDAFKILGQKLKGAPHWQNLEEIAEVERTYQATSSFYFIPRRGTYHNIKHADYDVRQESFREILSRLADNDFEIGLHPSAGSHLDEKQLMEDVALLGKKPHGGRFHFLMFDNRITPGLLEKAGLEYDSTLGFAEQIGFRNGYCSPFYLYDHQKNCPTSVLELPLVIMDTTLRNTSYMGVNPDDAIEVTLPVIDQIAKFGGAAAVLWHNNMFTDYKYREWKQVYLNLLEELHNRGAILNSAQKALN